MTNAGNRSLTSPTSVNEDRRSQFVQLRESVQTRVRSLGFGDEVNPPGINHISFKKHKV